MRIVPLGEVREIWRQRLELAVQQYAENPTAEARAECMLLLKIFADLIHHDKIPPE